MESTPGQPQSTGDDLLSHSDPLKDTLYIDILSGSFKPYPEHLEYLHALLLKAFPGLSITSLAVQDKLSLRQTQGIDLSWHPDKI